MCRDLLIEMAASIFINIVGVCLPSTPIGPPSPAHWSHRMTRRKRQNKKAKSENFEVRDFYSREITF